MPFAFYTSSLAIALLGCMFACGPAEESAQTRIPHVKIFEVGAEALGQTRTVSGQLAAADTSPLSFGVTGTVDQVSVSQGEAVIEGQLLATLDSQPLRLALERARSELSAARAKLVETEQAYKRTSGLLSQRAVSQSDVEIASSNLKSARASLLGATSQVEEAERDLNRAELRAPFEGHVAERSIEPFQEISGNEPAFVLQSEGALVVEAQVAEALIHNVDYGQPVRVTFPSLEGLELVGVVSLIASRAGMGNAFPIEVQLPHSQADLRPGMTASITFNFADYLDGQTAYLIPLSAIAIDVGLTAEKSAQKANVPVFVFDESSGQARIRKVRIGGLRGNQLEVFEGLEPGDQVISAGVPFLHDGMEVKRWLPTLGVTGG